MTTRPSKSVSLTRRDALRLSGAAGLGLLSAPSLATELLAASAEAQGGAGVTFPNGRRSRPSHTFSNANARQ